MCLEVVSSMSTSVEEEDSEEPCVPEATHFVIGLSASHTSASSNDSSHFRKTPLEIRHYSQFYAYFVPVSVYFQQNKKRRKPKVKIVTLQLCGVRKSR